MRFALFIFIAASLTIQTEAKSSNYKICVPHMYMDMCKLMTKVETKSKATLECVGARDRVECLYFVQQRQADFTPVDPEDMYVAMNIPNQDFVIFQEYRTVEEPDAEFRYEAVMVIHRSLKIDSLDGLQGLKSCHTGVNRNVGYKIPLTMLMKRTVFPKMNDRNISPKENELKALSTFFSKSCLVGKWSPDVSTNQVWKNRYPQLCALCQHPEQCDYPDTYSGYEGALRCLVHNGGQVAFTKVIYVRKFFGLPVGTLPASASTENADDYVYLCADGSRLPVKSKACSWAARPWQGLLGHNDILARLSPLRQKIKQLADCAGAAGNTDWFTKVLGLTEKISHVAENIPITPLAYLTKANYTDVIERGHGAPEPVIRLCVVSAVAHAKCRTMAVFAFSRDIRPRLDCIQADSETACLKLVRDNGAEITAVDGTQVGAAARKYNLHAVFHEVYGAKKEAPYAVAVVKRGSQITDMADLVNKRSCHAAYGTFEGLDAPVYALILKNISNPMQCPRLAYVANYFSGGSCLPGVEKLENNPTGESIKSLIKQCKQDPALNDPADCLKEGRGDVAFMNSLDLYQLNEDEYELLCINKPNGGRDTLSNYASCNIAMAPSRAWLAAKDFVSDVAIAHTPLSIAQLVEEKPELFNMYGQYMKNDNVIFNKRATGLAATETFDFSKVKSIHDANNFCISSR